MVGYLLPPQLRKKPLRRAAHLSVAPTAKGMLCLVPSCKGADVVPFSWHPQVRKSYEQHRARRRAHGQQRPWQLRRMAMEADDGAGAAERPAGGGSKAERKAAEAVEADRQRFIEVRHGLLHPMCCWLMRSWAVQAQMAQEGPDTVWRRASVDCTGKCSMILRAAVLAF